MQDRRFLAFLADLIDHPSFRQQAIKINNRLGLRNSASLAESPAISHQSGKNSFSRTLILKHPGHTMQNILFALRHPIKAWRSYSAMRGFEKLFGPYGKVPF